MKKDVERGLSISTLKEMFRLDSETGLIYWLERPSSHFKDGRVKTAQQIANKINSCYAGKLAFTSKHQLGYLRAEIDNKLFQAHRVAFALFHDKWPKDTIDHINGKTSDNRPANLRDVTHSGNMRNQALRIDNKSGVQGISLRENKHSDCKWIVEVRHQGKRVRKECASLDDAIQEKKSIASSLGFHENHGRNQS